MSDEDSKFSFSERTRVDEGSAADGDEELGAEDRAGATGVLSSSELEEAGILGKAPSEESSAPQPDAGESQTYEARTMMLDTSAADDATVAEVAAIDPDAESEATVAEVAAIDPDAESEATVAEITGLAFDPEDEDDSTLEEITDLPMEAQASHEATVALAEAIEDPGPQVVFRMVKLGDASGGRPLEVRGKKLVAGRHADCNLVIQDSSVSRRHFELTLTDAGYRLTDLGSGNGTLIDGERVSERLLTHGVTIEVGMSRFRWEDPREAPAEVDEDESAKTQMIDISQLQHDPSFDPNRKPGGAPPVQRPDRPPRSEPVARPARPRTSRADLTKTAQQERPSPRQLMQWGGLTTLGTLALIGALSLAGLLPMGGEGALDQEASDVTASASGEALMEEGLEAYKGWRWADARGYFEAAREQLQDKSAADEALRRVAQEEIASQVMETVRGSMETSQYKTAIEQLAGIPNTSVYYGDATALIKDAQEGIVSRHLERARELNQKGERQKALEELQAALKVLPKDAETLALLREYQESDEKPQVAESSRERGESKRRGRAERSSAKRRGSSRRGAQKFELEPDWPDAAPPTESKPAVAPLDIAPALSKYSSGKFAEAKKILDRVMRNTDSDRQRAKAKRLLGDITAFQRQWENGKSMAASEDLSGAIAALKRAKGLDKAISGAFKRRIDKLLADQYASQANNAMLSGNYKRAGSLAQRALKLSAGQGVARAVMTEVRKKADGWLSAAEAALSRNPDKAKSLLTQVLAVFPKSDPRYIRAYGMLKRIDASDDD